MLGSIICSSLGDTIGGLISGDINSWESFGRTVLISAGISVLSSGISKGVSKAYGTKQYNAIRGVSKNNTKVNKFLANLTGSYKKAGVSELKIGANSMSDFLKKLSRTTSNVLVTETVGNTVSTSINLWF